MSRSIDSSSSRMLPSPITNFVTPSSSFSSHQMHDIYSLAATYLQAPPPAYTPTTAFHPHSAAQLLSLHNMTAAVQVTLVPKRIFTNKQFLFQTPEDPDIDVVGLTDTTNLVSLNDEEEEEKLDQTTTSEESDRISIATTEESVSIHWSLSWDILSFSASWSDIQTCITGFSNLFIICSIQTICDYWSSHSEVSYISSSFDVICLFIRFVNPRRSCCSFQKIFIWKMAEKV